MTELDSDRTLIEPADPMVGAQISGRYQIRDRLAAGGFGAIYSALDLTSIELVALKILHPQLASDPAVVARFRREGMALASLRDPHIVRILDLGETEDGLLYIAMELLQGQNLNDVLAMQGVLPWQRVVAMAHGVCSALNEAHAIGIVHRDLKPANIHLEPDGSVRVLDFGIAKILHGSRLDDDDLTSIGQLVGTFDYMSPEQMVGGSCDARTDVFTLGIVMYEAITGHGPYGHATTAPSQLAALLGTTPQPMAVYTPVPAELETIVARCIARDPNDRYANARDVAADLERLAGGRGAVRRRVGSARLLPSTTLPGVVPPLRRPSQISPRLASGTSPIQNEPIAGPPAVPQRESSARLHILVWCLILTCVSAGAGLLLAQLLL